LKLLVKEILLMFLGIVALQSFTLSQTDSVNTNKEEIIDEIISENEANADNEGFGDLIEGLSDNPIDINTAGVSELQNIPNLTLSEAKAIIKYREKNGIFFSTAELNLVSGLSRETLKNILPFTKVNENLNISTGELTQKSPMSVEIRNRLIDRIQPIDGIVRNKFDGNKYKTYNRLKLGYDNHIKMGALFEKDPGENSYNDLTSAHISINNISIIKEIIVGDYLIGFGQGLAIWGPYSFSKSSNAIYPIKKKAKYLKGYTSSDENRFFRGISWKFDFNKLSLSFFYSKNKFDAAIDPATNNINSTPVDGYHRTENEINKKNSAIEQVMGGIIDISFNQQINLGFLYYHSSFNHKFSSSNVYDLQGDNYNFYSFSYDLFYKNINLFGESSFNGKSIASSLNLQIDVSKDFSLISSLRNYPRNYFNLHSNGFGEQNGKTQNEVGIYNGFRWRTDIGIINFYYDQFKFPFATYYNPLPTSGNEFMLDYFKRPFKHLSTRIKLKKEEKEISVNSATIKEIYTRNKISLRFEVIFKPTNVLRLKNRFEFNRFRINETGNSQTGYMVFQDVIFRPINKFYLAARIIFFKTDSFETAIYEFENDLDGVFALNGLYGQGTRWYAVIKYEPLAFLKISLKYSETYKPFERTLGSGYSKIDGNLDNKFSLQIDFDI